MSKKMLIDASHPEETRVVVVNGTRVEELDFESQNKRQLRGNVYLARVTRVEPSLQAAFVEFGGNRHGFLAFGEIHPDYYDLPHEDRLALIEAEAQAEAEDADDDDDDDEADAPTSKSSGPKKDGESSKGKSRSRRRRRSRGSNRNKTGATDPFDHIEGEDPLRPAATSFGMANRRKEIELPDPAIAAEAAKQTAKAEAEASKDAETPETSEAEKAPKKSKRRRSKKKPAQPARTPKSKSISKETEEDDEDENTPDPTRKAASSYNVASKLVFSNFDIEKDPTSAAADNFKHAESLKVADYDPSIIPEDDDEDDEASFDTDTDDEIDPEILEDAADDDDAEVAEEQAKVHKKRKQRISRRRYKIQEVIKRGQIMLVQAVKEERGNKGAALTTYLSLAGRYCVLMPNTPRGGGISRKIANGSDRRRLKSIMSELEVPKGMGVIVRTAGASRSRDEIQHDYEYLARLWEKIRNKTLESFAPALIHQEGDLVKRSLRDMYNKEISEILVQGDEAYEDARNFIDMLMPAHSDKVKRYEDDIPLFLRYQVEQQIEASLDPVAQLKSGGYLVIHPTEALVSVDVNSGRSTKERNVERTALKTNLEAAEEVARQMRLRDLAGLIVIDFIDMDESRNNRAVENKMKEALSRDRARVQMARISKFGLMEISRQRRRRSLLEGSSASCEHCGGVGRKRSVESSALKAIRAVEEEGIRGRAKRIRLRVSPGVALYLFNEKRDMVSAVDSKFEMFTELVSDDKLHRPEFEIEIVDERDEKRTDPLEKIKREAKANAQKNQNKRSQSKSERPEQKTSESSEDEGGNNKRRKRGGRNKNRNKNANQDASLDASTDSQLVEGQDSAKADMPENGEEQPRKRRRRRGRRGGRGNRNNDENRSAEGNSEGNAEASGDNKADNKDVTPDSSQDGNKPAKKTSRRKKAPAKSESQSDIAPAKSQTDASEDTKPSKPKRVRAKAPSRTKAAPKKAKDDATVTDTAPSEPAPKASSDKPKRVRKRAPAPKKADPELAAPSENIAKPAQETDISAAPKKTKKKGWFKNPFKTED